MSSIDKRCGCCDRSGISSRLRSQHQGHGQHESEYNIVDERVSTIPKLLSASNGNFSSKYNMDELLDTTVIHRQRIKIFVPITSDAEFENKWDRLNASTIIHPLSTFRFIWDFLILAILIFTCFEIPLTLSFGIDDELNLNTTYGAIVLLTDILLCFRRHIFIDLMLYLWYLILVKLPVII